MTILKKLKVTNACGLHTRPATLVVQYLQDCDCEVKFSYKDKVVDAKSVLNLLLLSVKQGAEIEVSIVGVDAKKVLQKLEEMFRSNFGEKK